MQAQQVQRANRVVFFGCGAGLVPHQLRHYPSRCLQPFGERFERPSQAVQSQTIDARHLACVLVQLVGGAHGFADHGGIVRPAGKNPFVYLGQAVQQARHMRRQRNDPLALHLVTNRQTFPLFVHVFPAQAEHFPRARAREQDDLQIGRC